MQPRIDLPRPGGKRAIALVSPKSGQQIAAALLHSRRQSGVTAMTFNHNGSAAALPEPASRVSRLDMGALVGVFGFSVIVLIELFGTLATLGWATANWLSLDATGIEAMSAVAAPVALWASFVIVRFAWRAETNPAWAESDGQG